MTDPRKPFADALREVGVDFNRPGVITAFDDLLDKAGIPRTGTPPPRRVSADGVALIQRFESCRLSAYPDPGSHDGNPWTIGWGSTGPDIKKGVTWTQAQCDERFRGDLSLYERQVEKALSGAPTTPHQFDALVSLAYNIGGETFAKSTLLKKHRAADYAGAAREFGRWIYNDGHPLAGLVKRRAAEAELYGEE